eukprot:520013-Prymnesium_polylepis.1
MDMHMNVDEVAEVGPPRSKKKRVRSSSGRSHHQPRRRRLHVGTAPGAMSCLSSARPDARPLAGSSAFSAALSRRPLGADTLLPLLCMRERLV